MWRALIKIDVITLPVSERNGYRVAKELSSGDELTEGFLNGPRWVGLFQKKTL
jgi:hypothetical protein